MSAEKLHKSIRENHVARSNESASAKEQRVIYDLNPLEARFLICSIGALTLFQRWEEEGWGAPATKGGRERGREGDTEWDGQTQRRRGEEKTSFHSC